jgi:hypothetical protein
MKWQVLHLMGTVQNKRVFARCTPRPRDCSVRTYVRTYVVNDRPSEGKEDRADSLDRTRKKKETIRCGACVQARVVPETDAGLVEYFLDTDERGRSSRDQIRSHMPIEPTKHPFFCESWSFH